MMMLNEFYSKLIISKFLVVSFYYTVYTFLIFGTLLLYYKIFRKKEKKNIKCNLKKFHFLLYSII